MRIKVIFGGIEYRKDLKWLSRLSDYTKDFEYCWAVWGHWKKNNLPIVALHGKKVVGFHGPGYGLGVSYADSYFQGVLQEYKGQGIGGMMLKPFFTKAHKLGIRRLRFRTDVTANEAIAFWKGFGLKPFATRDKYLLWDIDIRQVKDGESLKAWMKMKSVHFPIPDRAMKHYIKIGAKIL